MIFEPDKFLINKYLKKLKYFYNNIKIYPFGLSNKNELKTLYQANYKNLFIHLNNSFSKKYILKKIKNNYPDKFSLFKYNKKKFQLKNLITSNTKKKYVLLK